MTRILQIEKVLQIAKKGGKFEERGRESYSDSKIEREREREKERERELAKKKKGSHLKRIPEAAV